MVHRKTFTSYPAVCKVIYKIDIIKMKWAILHNEYFRYIFGVLSHIFNVSLTCNRVFLQCGITTLLPPLPSGYLPTKAPRDFKCMGPKINKYKCTHELLIGRITLPLFFFFLSFVLNI